MARVQSYAIYELCHFLSSCIVLIILSIIVTVIEKSDKSRITLVLYKKPGLFNGTRLVEMARRSYPPYEEYNKTYQLRRVMYVDIWDAASNTSVDGEWSTDIAWNVEVSHFFTANSAFLSLQALPRNCIVVYLL